MSHDASHAVILARLAQARQELDLSQAELARRTGVPQSQISKLESGQAIDITLRTTQALCAGLGIPMGTLCAVDDGAFVRALKLSQEHMSRQIRALSNPEDLVPIRDMKYGVDELVLQVTRAGAHGVLLHLPSFREGLEDVLFTNDLEEIARRAFAEVAVHHGLRLLIRPSSNGKHETLACIPGRSADGSDLVADINLLREKAHAVPMGITGSYGVLRDALRLEDTGTPLAKRVRMNDLAPQDVELDRGIMRIGHRAAVAMQWDELPYAVADGWIQDLIMGLDVSVTVDVQPVERATWLRHARERLGRNGSWGIGIERERRLASAKLLIESVEAGATSVFRSRVTCLAYGQDVESARAQADLLERRCDGAGVRLRVLHYRQDVGYAASLPTLPEALGSGRAILHSQGVATLLPAMRSDPGEWATQLHLDDPTISGHGGAVSASA